MHGLCCVCRAIPEMRMRSPHIANIHARTVTQAIPRGRAHWPPVVGNSDGRGKCGRFDSAVAVWASDKQRQRVLLHTAATRSTDRSVASIVPSIAEFRLARYGKYPVSGAVSPRR